MKRHVLVGIAVPVNSLSADLGGFKETFAASALDRTFHEGIDLRALVDHDPRWLLARLSAGTMSWHASKRGLEVEVVPPAAQWAEDLVESVRRKDIQGMSIAFHAVKVEWSQAPDGTPVRTVTDARIRETSVVTWPAYFDTEVALAYREMPVVPERRVVMPQQPIKPGSRLEVSAPKLGDQREGALAELAEARAHWAKAGSRARYMKEYDDARRPWDAAADADWRKAWMRASPAVRQWASHFARGGKPSPQPTMDERLGRQLNAEQPIAATSPSRASLNHLRQKLAELSL